VGGSIKAVFYLRVVEAAKKGMHRRRAAPVSCAGQASQSRRPATGRGRPATLRLGRRRRALLPATPQGCVADEATSRSTGTPPTPGAARCCCSVRGFRVRRAGGADAPAPAPSLVVAVPAPQLVVAVPAPPLVAAALAPPLVPAALAPPPLVAAAVAADDAPSGAPAPEALAAAAARLCLRPAQPPRLRGVSLGPR